MEDIPSPKKGTATPNPMDEENFPPNNPTRRSAEKHMNEPSNVRGSQDPVPRRMPTTEAGGEGSEGGEAANVGQGSQTEE